MFSAKKNIDTHQHTPKVFQLLFSCSISVIKRIQVLCPQFQRCEQSPPPAVCKVSDFYSMYSEPLLIDNSPLGPRENIIYAILFLLIMMLLVYSYFIIRTEMFVFPMRLCLCLSL